MKEIDCEFVWCPQAVVAVQRGVGGQEGKPRLETIPVAYNRTTMALNPMDDEVLGKHCCCIGSYCALWQNSVWNWLRYVPVIGYFKSKRGRCGLSRA